MKGALIWQGTRLRAFYVDISWSFEEDIEFDDITFRFRGLSRAMPRLAGTANDINKKAKVNTPDVLHAFSLPCYRHRPQQMLIDYMAIRRI